MAFAPLGPPSLRAVAFSAPPPSSLQLAIQDSQGLSAESKRSASPARRRPDPLDARQAPPPRLRLCQPLDRHCPRGQKTLMVALQRAQVQGVAGACLAK